MQVCAVQLPGRGRRIKEPAFRRLSDIVQPLTEALLPYLGSRFAFFGHSMGALISFEMIRRLRKVHRLKATHLFVSGCYAPHIPDPNPLYSLPDQELIEKLKRLQGSASSGTG
jgi:medium-chain acyl-[acyl-carrier-protein] hydrolase